MNTGKMPTFSAKDAVPPEVQHMIDETNGAMADMNTALDQLNQVVPELTALADKAAALPSTVPDQAKSAGLSMTDSLAAPKNTAANVKTLGGAKDEAVKLLGSLTQSATDIAAAFPQ
jgi:hypothetical protein